MPTHIRVTILDDHQSIIDGYLYRLSHMPEIEVVATVAYGEDLEQTLADNPTDILLMDVNVPTSVTNTNPFPLLHYIPKIQKSYPNIAILVISMFAERALIKAVMEAGVSGYILKEDKTTIQDLGNVITTVSRGGVYFSREAHSKFVSNQNDDMLLTARQLEVLSMFAAQPDLTSNAAALKLNISDSTIRNLLSGAYLRLGVQNRAAAIIKARQIGILTPISTRSGQTDME